MLVIFFSFHISYTFCGIHCVDDTYFQMHLMIDEHDHRTYYYMLGLHCLIITVHYSTSA